MKASRPARLGLAVDLMLPDLDLTTLICASALLILSLYAAGLWAYALIRTGLVFCYFIFIGALISVVVSVLALLLHIDPHIAVRWFGKAGWWICYYFIIVIQPVASITSVIGSTILVRWVIKDLTRR